MAVYREDPAPRVLCQRKGGGELSLLYKKANKWQPMQEFLSKRFEACGIISPSEAIITVYLLASRFYKNPTGMTLGHGLLRLERHTASVRGLPLGRAKPILRGWMQGFPAPVSQPHCAARMARRIGRTLTANAQRLCVPPGTG